MLLKMKQKIGCIVVAFLLLTGVHILAEEGEWKLLDKSWKLGLPFELPPRYSPDIHWGDVYPHHGIAINAPYYATNMRVTISGRKFSRKKWVTRDWADVVIICDMNGKVYHCLKGESTEEETYEIPGNGIRVQVFSYGNASRESLNDNYIEVKQFEYFVPNRLEIDEHFPEGFFWGAATSAFQVEGNCNGTDWWEWANGLPGRCHGDKIGDATDHYNRYEEDFDIAKEMGLNMVRISIEWGRIEPEEPKDGEEPKWNRNEIDHYRNVLKALHDRKIEPMVTLFHFSQPTWFANKGGFENDKNIKYFIEYVKKITSEFSGLVTYYITINEPETLALGGWNREGGLPPGKENNNLACKVFVNCFEAHAKAYWAIHEIDPKAKVSLAKNMRVMAANNFCDRPLNPEPGKDLPVDALIMNQSVDKPTDFSKWLCDLGDKFTNQSYLDALLTGRICVFLGPGCSAERNIPELKGALDFFAVNYYTRDRIFFHLWYDTDTKFVLNMKYRPDQHEYTPMGKRWEYAPDAFYTLMMRLKKFSVDFSEKCGKELDGIIIAENGVGDVDDVKLADETMRSRFIIDHLHYLHKAIRDGADVRGYLHWSLLDNFELAEGYRAQFGLIAVDCRNDKELKRTWKDSAKLYQKIIRDNGLTNTVIPYVRK